MRDGFIEILSALILLFRFPLWHDKEICVVRIVSDLKSLTQIFRILHIKNFCLDVFPLEIGNLTPACFLKSTPSRAKIARTAVNIA